MRRRPLTPEERCAWPIDIRGAMSVVRSCRYRRGHGPGKAFCSRHAKVMEDLALREKRDDGPVT